MKSRTFIQYVFMFDHIKYVVKNTDLQKHAYDFFASSYINQLTVCKSLVEKRIRLLGGADYKSYGDDEDGGTDARKLPGNKVLSFTVIMENPITRDYFVR